MLHRIARVLRTTQVVTLVLVCGFGVSLVHYLTAFDNARSAVERSHQVLEAVEEARLNTLRSGTWMRNYAVVERHEFLERCRAAATTAVESARLAELLTRDNAPQNLRAQALLSEVQETVAGYLAAANVAERDGSEAVNPLIVERVGKDTTKDLRQALDAMETAERRMLDERNALERERLMRVKQHLMLVTVVFAGSMLWSIGYSGKLLRIGSRELRELAAQAARDPLTGLLNRRELAQRMKALARLEPAPGERVALLAFDLNDFKPINDRHGHAAGDTVLRTVADRLRHQCRQGDLIARMGGDEFVVVLTRVASREEAAHIAERIAARLAAPIPLEGTHLLVGASVGVAMLEADGHELEALLAAADRRMYAAKAAAKAAPEPAETAPAV